jgi:integrase
MSARYRPEMAQEQGKTAADRAKSALGAFLCWCVERDLISTNPTIGIKRRANGGSRERVLSAEKLVAIWQATDGGTDYHNIIRLLLLTGQRKTEIGGLRWSEIDFAAREINLPAGRVKNKQAHFVPLSDIALDMLRGVVPVYRRDTLFGGAVDGFSGWSKAKALLDEKLGDLVRPLDGA